MNEWLRARAEVSHILQDEPSVVHWQYARFRQVRAIQRSNTILRA